MSLPETVEVRKLTVREFHALEPVLDPGYRYELLDGRILVMPIPGNPHAVVLDELNAQFSRQARPGLHVSSGGLWLNETTELLPDLSLLDRKRRGRENPPAATAKLVIEVSDTTFDRDTGEKLQAYRAAGVPEYWVADVRGRCVLRHLLPDYRAEAFSEGALSPRAYPDVIIDLGTLFEGLGGE
ncbi:MAG: Uma2 family endonuclease [Verrucomicrobia bacterium]|nr:Uma2 family endonuclease [Verrucomicrobiota bacterium]